MPELSEAETIRRHVAPLVEGRHIVGAWAHLPRITRPSVAAFAGNLPGRRIMAARRRGKQMYFPLDEGFDEEAMAERLGGKRCALKAALLDQKVVAGIGNIYADEICFLAGVNPARVAASVSGARLRRLVSHMRPVLERAVETQGATARPTGRYYDMFGQSGEFLPSVYGRTVESCPPCQTPVRRGALGSGRSARSYHWCPRCQR